MGTMTHRNVALAAEACLVLNDSELRALNALTQYGDDAFLESFYKQLGTACLREHEAGLKSLFETVRKHVAPLLAQADKATDILQEERRKEVERRDQREAEQRAANLRPEPRSIAGVTAPPQPGQNQPLHMG